MKEKAFFRNDAASYAQFRPTYPDELATYLAKLTPGRGMAVDAGCGNGQLTVLLAPYFDEVIGIDPSEGQLDYAKSADNVRYIRCAAEQTDLADSSVDLIVAAQAVHWFDLHAFYAEVRRIAAGNAVIALISYGVPFIDDVVNAIFQKGYWQDLHGFWPPERTQVETGYADLYFPFSPVDFPAVSIRKTVSLPELVNYIRTWSAYEVASELNCLDAFETYFAQLDAHWRAPERKEIVWPVSVKLARVGSFKQ